MGEEEGDHTMEEVEEEQEVEDFSNSKDTALAGFLNINGYVKSILKVDAMMRKAATLTPGLPVSWGIDKGYPGLFFCCIFQDSIHLLLFWQNFHFLVALV